MKYIIIAYFFIRILDSIAKYCWQIIVGSLYSLYHFVGFISPAQRLTVLSIISFFKEISNSANESVKKVSNFINIMELDKAQKGYQNKWIRKYKAYRQHYSQEIKDIGGSIIRLIPHITVSALNC